MEIWERTRDGITFLRPRTDRLDSGTAPELKSAVNGRIRDGATSIVINLTDVEFMDSSGLGVMISALRALDGRGDLMVCCVGDSVKALLRLTGMTRVFPLFDHERDVCSRSRRPI